MNGWFVNILPPLKFPSLPCSHASSLSRSIPPPLTSSLPSFPRAVHASFGPFLARSLHQPSHLTLHWRSLPPSLPPSTITDSATAPPPIQLNVGLPRVWRRRAALSRSYPFSVRTPTTNPFFTNSKKSDGRNRLQTHINTVEARTFPTVYAATPRAR